MNGTPFCMAWPNAVDVLQVLIKYTPEKIRMQIADTLAFGEEYYQTNCGS